jgi:hypothetical protein
VVIAAATYLLVPVPVSAECLDRQAQLRQEIDGVNYCIATEDCEVQALYCPFDCWIFANRQANFAQIKVQIDAYGTECGVCLADCSNAPPKPECVEGKCVIT